ncbi:fatty acid desaturase 6-like [Mercenaria mercenaria]|uniref:fatty acid desaturase 6-like n=1 Tax=Mercenaria mercenaria TaxID=6596 RepID=UPI00234E4D45|nr:fatty acid desaturase 6-like [Mercenaria mercenaria]
MDVKARTMGKNENNVYDTVKLDTLPKFSDLRSKVDVILKQSSWWDFYGVDWAINGLFLLLLPVSLLLIRAEEWLYMALGIFLLGWIHSVFATKSGHLAAHGSLSSNKVWSRPLSVLFVEVIGAFSEEMAYDIHIKEHHPYTNIIGIGDSSTWKVPFLPRYVYMFMAPVLIPPLAPLVSIAGLVEKRSYFGIMKYLIRAGFGLFVILYLLMTVSHCSLWGAVGIIWASRAVLSIPYIHVNIFQHIGLPMYKKESKPVRIYQMATGVLNLPSNPVLDYAFGHSIMSCHVEHHLFPQLSDNMCLKIKPIVSKFLKNSTLPYNEKTYMNRLRLFIDKYDTLMVNAPPITHFVGIQ